MATATFAAGCFWGVEAAFQQIPGVTATRVGYTGGTYPNPTYQDVCSDTTGHAEAVQVEYDPDIVPYHDLLETFFSLHDPTSKDRQGPDTGKQYRSAVFYHTEQQKEEAEQMVRDLNQAGRYQQPIVTAIVPAEEFWQAEEEHQSFYLKIGRRYGNI
jgi:peptide-methionine (S)-S-oxide reductase